MPTYNYRLTGRDIKTLSEVESTDRVLLWGADSIHCGHPGCRFEICAVGGENVMGGAMQEGWGIKPLSADEINQIDINRPPTISIADAVTVSPWRCALHLTDEHKPITPEMIAEHCPGPPSPEYQRGHADGFEQGMKAAQRPISGFIGKARAGVDIPTADEIAEAFNSRGGLNAVAPLMTSSTMQFISSNRGKDLLENLSEQFGAPAVVTQSLFVIGMLSASLYFNDKYGDQIEAVNNPRSAVQ